MTVPVQTSLIIKLLSVPVTSFGGHTERERYTKLRSRVERSGRGLSSGSILKVGKETTNM
jgi:hypothetical protein